MYLVWVLLFLGTALAAVNNFDGDLHFQCESHQAISQVTSDHSNYYEDRVFSMSCRDVKSDTIELTATCDWTGWENAYDGLLAFECDGNHYINGMKSHHDNYREDRVWGFNCCEMHEIHLYDCKTTEWTNDWDRHQYFTVPSDYVLKGVVSIHNNHVEDRRYQYTICRVTTNEGGAVIGKRERINQL